MQTTEKSYQLAGFIFAIGGAILFSTKAILVKLAFLHTGIDAISLLTLRMVFSLPFYLIAAWLGTKKEDKTRLSYKQLGWIILLGIFGYYLSSLFDFIGLQYVSAGLERLILFLYPTFAVLLNTFLFKVALKRIQIIALALSYAGIGIAYFAEIKTDFTIPGFYYGSFMIFLCAITYSFYLVGTGKLVQAAGATRYTAYAMLAASVGVFIHFMLTRSVTDIHFSSTLIYYAIALALVATVIPSFLMSAGMKRIGSNNVSIITSVGPVSTIIQAYFLLGEKVLFLQVAGTILVIAGVVLIGWQTQKNQEDTGI
ncbi:MAG: DMT family transporter [Sediminibacterium sp.]|nr:DMT family transporter [Sediminibacterium sp.]MBX9778821.1 DMT family transporter [Chitinophagaceae bacterium]